LKVASLEQTRKRRAPGHGDDHKGLDHWKIATFAKQTEGGFAEMKWRVQFVQ